MLLYNDVHQKCNTLWVPSVEQKTKLYNFSGLIALLVKEIKTTVYSYIEAVSDCDVCGRPLVLSDHQLQVQHWSRSGLNFVGDSPSVLNASASHSRTPHPVYAVDN